jgi:hypothetical protein
MWAISKGFKCDSICTGLSGMRYFFLSDPNDIWFEIVEDARS